MLSLQIDTSDNGSNRSWYEENDDKEEVTLLKKFDEMFEAQLTVGSNNTFVLPLKRICVLGMASIYLYAITTVAILNNDIDAN